MGEHAKGLFGDYENVPIDSDVSARVKKTGELLDKPNVIAEASFLFDNNFCSVDILKNDSEGVEIYEVKSSTKVKDIYLDDVAYQYYVLSNLGFNVKKASIVYINKDYVRGKELDVSQLFTIEEVTDDTILKQDEIRQNIQSMSSCKSMTRTMNRTMILENTALTRIHVISGTIAQETCQSIMFSILEECRLAHNLRNIGRAKCHLRIWPMRTSTQNT